MDVVSVSPESRGLEKPPSKPFTGSLDDWKKSFDDYESKPESVSADLGAEIRAFLKETYEATSIGEAKLIRGYDGQATGQMRPEFVRWMIEQRPWEVLEMVEETKKIIFSKSSKGRIPDAEYKIEENLRERYGTSDPDEFKKKVWTSTGEMSDWKKSAAVSLLEDLANRKDQVTLDAIYHLVTRREKGLREYGPDDIEEPVSKEAKTVDKNEIWENGDTLIKAKNAIFDPSNTERNLVGLYKNDFLEKVYGVKTIQEALVIISERQGPEIEQNTVRDILASDFLYWLRDTKKLGAIKSIETYSESVSKPEKKPVVEPEPKKEKKPEKPEIPFYENTSELNQYNLRFNEAALNRLAEGAQGTAKGEIDAEIVAVKEMFAALTKGPRDVEAFGFETNGKKIENVVLNLKSKMTDRDGNKIPGMEIKVSAEVFRKAFGIWYYADEHGNEGFKFYAGGDRSEYVTARTPQALLDRIMLREVSFNGVRLGGERSPDDDKVYIWKGPSRPPAEDGVSNSM